MRDRLSDALWEAAGFVLLGIFKVVWFFDRHPPTIDYNDDHTIERI